MLYKSQKQNYFYITGARPIGLFHRDSNFENSLTENGTRNFLQNGNHLTSVHRDIRHLYHQHVSIHGSLCAKPSSVNVDRVILVLLFLLYSNSSFLLIKPKGTILIQRGKGNIFYKSESQLCLLISNQWRCRGTLQKKTRKGMGTAEFNKQIRHLLPAGSIMDF